MLQKKIFSVCSIWPYIKDKLFKNPNSTQSSANTLAVVSGTIELQKKHILYFVSCLLMGLLRGVLVGSSLHIFTPEVVKYD